MKLIKYIPVLLLFTFGCKEEEVKDDCEVKNYGIVRLNYLTTSPNRHKVIITQNGVIVREKISAIADNADTIHLAPDRYELSIAEIDNAGSPVNQSVETVNPTMCSDQTFTVNF